MSLRFLLGRAGSGKTFACVQAIAHELQQAPVGSPLIFLVPEQATFQMEQALVEKTSVQGFGRLQILSFRRLAQRVVLEVGGAARPRLGEMGKRMLLRTLVERRRGDLQLFGSGRVQPGFIERLANTLSEMRAHGHTPDAVRTAAERADSPITARKLHDVALLYQEYVAHLGARFTDSDSLFDQAISDLARSKLVSDAHVWIDGFAGFSPQEYAMLGEILTAAASVEMALCLDVAAGSRDGGALFEPVARTMAEVTALAKARKVPVLSPRHFSPDEAAQIGRFRRAPLLAHIEREWTRPYGRRYAGQIQGVAVHSAEDRVAEVEAAAGEIVRLCRDEGYRYREISVVVRDLDTYGDLLAGVFEESGIPYFLDRRRPVASHPLVELVTAALDVVRSHWSTEHVLRYLKTDLVATERDAVDRIENYVLAHGISGTQWTRPFRGGPGNALAELEVARQTSVAPLVTLERSLRPSGGELSPKAAAAALWAFLEKSGARGALARWIEEAEASGDLAAAGAHRQVWDGVMDLITQLANVVPAAAIRAEELFAMVEAGLDSLRLGHIPPKLDQVLVGQVDRSRQPDVRAVFVLGLVDRQFPGVPPEDALFSDAEREELGSRGFPLGTTSRLRLEQERFLVYIALTRASERLWLSYPTSDGNGRALYPSAAIGRLRQLVPGIAVSPLEVRNTEHLRETATPLALAGRTAAALRRDASDALWLDVYEWLLHRFRDQAEPVLRALGYTNRIDPLASDVASALYGGTLQASVSRLERFAACAFQHFAADGLRLTERELPHLDAGRLGQLAHEALRLFVAHLLAEGTDWRELPDEEAMALIDRVVAEVADNVLRGGGTARERYVVNTVRRKLHTVIRVLSEQARAGAFRPVAVEVGFGRPGDTLEAWEVSAPGGGAVHLRGIIDRIDEVQIEGTRYVLIMDYKSRQRPLQLGDVVYGLELQLLAYLAVAVRGRSAKPAGALYMPVVDPVVRGEGDANAVWRERKKGLRPRGMLLADTRVTERMHSGVTGESDLFPFGIKKDGTYSARSQIASDADLEALLYVVEKHVGQMAQKIQDGEHSASPFRRPSGSRPCDYCPYHSVCRFDVLVDGSDYRHLPSLRQDEAWATLRRMAAER